MSAAKSPWPIATAMSRGGQDGQRHGRAAASEDPQRRGAGVREPGAGQGRDACAGFAGWSARSCAGCRCVMSRRRSRRPSRSRSFSEHRVTDLRGQPRALPGVVPAWAGRAHGPPAHRRPRRIHSDRVVLLTDVPWRMVPAAGVWERLHRELRRRLNAAGLIDWTRDRRFKPHSRSSRGSDAPSPVDRGRPGSKHHCETPEALVAGSSPRAVIRSGRLAAAGMTPSTIRPLRGVLIGIYLLVAAGANLSSTERESSRRPSRLASLRTTRHARLSTVIRPLRRKSSSGQFRRVGACPVRRGCVLSKQRPLPLSHTSRRVAHPSRDCRSTGCR
jgi:hypothetical protein